MGTATRRDRGADSDDRKDKISLSMA